MSLPKETAGFLKTLFEFTDQNVEFRSVSNDVGGDSRSLFSRDFGEIAAFVKRHDVAGRGVYFGVSTRRIGSPTGARRDCVETPAVWVDIDTRKMKVAKRDAIAALTTWSAPPSLIIDSGNGLHAYWLLNEPAIVDDATPEGREMEERIVSILKRLAGVFAGDFKVCDLARILRLPGTHNSKPMALEANDGKPIPCVVAGGNGKGRYDASGLEDLLDTQRPLVERPVNEQAAARGDAPPDDPYVRYAKESGLRVPLDARREMAAMTYLGDGDASIHHTQLRVSGHMVARGYDDEQIVEALMAATIAASGWQGNNWNWKREERKIRGLIAGARKHGYDTKAKAAADAAAQADQALHAATASTVGGGDAQTVVAGARDAAAAGMAGTVSLDAKRAEKTRKKKAVVGDSAPQAQGGAEKGDAAATKTDVEAVAGAVLLKWEAERGMLRYAAGDFHTCARGLWARFDHQMAHGLKVEISEMTCACGKRPTSTFLDSVRRRMTEMNTLQLSAEMELDSLGWIACNDASINVTTGAMAVHSPDHFTTIHADCDIIEPSGTHNWLNFLNEAFADRGEAERDAVVGTLQEWLGSALVRGKSKATSRALILYGESGTGKTRFANVVVNLMGGPARVSALAVGQLKTRFGAQGLVGRTAWVRDDGISAGDDLQCEAFKNIVTGDRMNVERKMMPDATISGGIPVLLTANALPKIADPTDAVYDRLLLCPLNIKRGQKDGEIASATLDAALKEELSGILLWAIEGWKRLEARGRYEMPETMGGAARELREANNPIQTWIDECVTASEKHRVHRTDLLCSLNSWFNETMGSHSRNGFGARTMNVHLRVKIPGVDVDQRSNGQVYVKGVKLTDAGLATWEKGAFNNDPTRRPFSNSTDTVNRSSTGLFA